VPREDGGLAVDVLIIGGTGLISTAITRVLLGRGDRVTLVNRGRTPLRLPPELPRPKLLVGDRADPAAFARLLEEAGRFDAVIDMVAFQPEQVSDVARTLRGRVGQYVFTSSVDAYVKPYRRSPVTQDHPIGGLTEYGKAKAACEALLFAAHGPAFPVTIIRPGHTSGEGGQGLDLFGWNSHYLDRIERGLPVILHGDGTSLWGTAYVDDVARAYAAALGNPRARGRAYHLTSDEVLTWDQIYVATATALDVRPPERVPIPTRLLFRALPQLARECLENFAFNNVFDNTAARLDLGFTQTVSFVELMRRLNRWLVEHGKRQRAEDLPVYDAILSTWQPLASTFVERVSTHDRAPSRLGFE
jgi:nucleoside-diphosphate-sugar epimerase